MKLQGKRWRKAALAAVALGGLLVLLGFFFPAQLLCIDNAPAQADFLVVLGGGSELRAAHAAELYKNGVAPRILVTGDGERAVGKRALLAAGVANESINTEWDSKNTRQNAEFSAKLLRAKGAKRVIIVTSWFHSRRALACFRKAAPDIAFYSSPTVSDRPNTLWPGKSIREQFLSEYAKIGWYCVRYGILPI